MEPKPWNYEDETALTHIQMRYNDREAIGKEALRKRKALGEMKADDPFYHRACAAAEMAALRYDMAYIVADNRRLRDMIGSISWLSEQIGILQGAYAHVKMLAERCRIDYGLINSGLSQIVKMKQELENAITQRSNKTDGTKG